MRPCVTVGWGASLHLIHSPLGPRSVATTLVAGAGSKPDVNNEYNASTSVGFTDNYWDALWGGPTSMPPMASCHKPGVFYHGQFYYSAHNVDTNNPGCYLLRFDGSGVFAQVADATNGFGNKSLSGRGVELLSASGTNAVQARPMACLEHNGHVIYVGMVQENNINVINNAWIDKKGWHGIDFNLPQTGDDAGTGLGRRRAYSSFTIRKTNRIDKEFKKFGQQTLLYKRTGPSGLMVDYECANACDAISWANDIIYANSCDIIQFLGGSGTARAIEITNSPSQKCFEPFPSGGFNTVTGQAVGDTELLVLSSSGVLRKILFPGDPLYNPSGRPFGADLFDDVQPIASGRPFGTEALFNLGSLVSDADGPKVRTQGSRARLVSFSAEPDRTCFLKTYANRLHAFFISAASGYYHFTCEGDPRFQANWTDRTTSLPGEFKLFDGNMYGFRDDKFGSLNMMHVARSNIGAFGTQGGNSGAGGWTIYQINPDNEWKKLSCGGASGPSQGLISYPINYGVYAQVPSGISSVAPGNPQLVASTDYAILTYKLFSHRKPGIFANVTVEYSVDEGCTWSPATRFRDYTSGAFLGDGTTDLEATPFGTSFDFYWAHVTDLGFNFPGSARLRVSPEVARV